jgi:hypothetical protein
MRSKLWPRVLCVWPLLVVGTIFAQEAQELDGWRAAKWGMTEADVLAAFAGEATRLEKPEEFRSGDIGKVEIPKYEVQSTKYRVRFGFDDKGALSLVVIGPPDNGTVGVSHESAFRSLESLLTEKYGKPTSAKDEVPTRTRMWRFPRTVISLTYFVSAAEFDLLLLSYRPPSKEADKL